MTVSPIIVKCHLMRNQTILTNDKDLLQLVNQQTSVFLTRTETLVTHKDKIKVGKLPMSVPIPNIPIVKILLGDRSDNIKGIMYFGEKSLIKHFPEIEKDDISIEEILNKTK